MKKLLSLGAGISLLALLSACSGLDRNHEIALNQATGIEVTQGENGVQMRLPEKVLFNFDQSTLRTDAAPALARAVVLLKRSNKPVIVEGHTDNVGTHEYNMQLSEARATTVVNALEERDIPVSRITTRGFAYDRPVASNDTPEDQARNRRTEIVIVGESEERILGR
ncbi:OmpA family protein [Paraburkholderia sp. BL10I2N1]|uniref:OmpA family protein n=1 Tax=Paraburkholderia sp. BL10I2N1 TaxID=1938796 RepID=UPI00105C4BEA|nr:OmpA family protein [Paraburkholderia sp. BL10I2N1]